MTKANTTTLQAFAGVTTLQYFKPTVDGQYQNPVFIAEPTDVSAGLTVTAGIEPNTDPSNPYKNMGYFNISGGAPNTTATFVLWLKFENVPKAIPHKFTVEFYEDVITAPPQPMTPIDIAIFSSASRFEANIKGLQTLQPIAFTVASDFYGNLKGLTAIKNTVLTGASAFLGTLKGLKAITETITFTSFSSLTMAGLKGLTAVKNVSLNAGSSFVANLKALAKISPVFSGASNFSATVKGMKTVGTALFTAASLFAMARLTSAPDFPIDETNQAKVQAAYYHTQVVKGYTGRLFTIRRLSDNATMDVFANPATRDIDKAAINTWRAGADVDIDVTAGFANQMVGVKIGATTTTFKPTATNIAFIRSNVYQSLATIFNAESVPNRLTRDPNNGAVGSRIIGSTSHLSMATSGIVTTSGLEMHLAMSPNNRKAPISATGSVTNVTPTAGGSGYSSSLTRPILAYLTGGGVTDTVAQITPTITSGAITAFSVSVGGTGYTTGLIPLWISDTTGGGCLAMGVASSGAVTNVLPWYLDGTYTQSGTTVTVTKTAHGLTAGQQIYFFKVAGAGVSGLYTISSVTANTFTYTAGTSLSITTAVACTVLAHTTATNGTGYSSGATVVVMGGNKVGMIKCYQTAGAITATKLVDTEKGYTSNPTATIANPHGGTGATFSVTTNLLGDVLGSDSRGEILMAYGATATNQAVLKMFGTNNTFQARRISATGVDDQLGNTDSYTMNANSLQILSWNIKDSTDTTKMKIHSFGASPTVINYTTNNSTANDNAPFQNATLKVGSSLSTSGPWFPGGTGNSGGDFIFGGIIITDTLTEKERATLHGRMRLKAEPHLNLSTTELNALFSERLDFRDVDGSRLLMGKEGKLALQFNVSTPFGGWSPDFTYNATAPYLGLQGVKFNNDRNLANTFQSVTTGTATADYWTQQNEGSYLVIGTRDATGLAGGYTSNLSDWFSIATGNPPDQTIGAKPVNNSLAAIWHHSQAAMLTKIADLYDINGKTGVTQWNDQPMWQLGMKYFYPTGHGGLDDLQLLPSSRTVEGISYPTGTLLNMELLEGTLNKYVHTPEQGFISGNSINTPKNLDYAMCQIGTFKNGATYDKNGSQASRDANARTATVKSYVAPVTGTTIGAFDCSYARQIGTANNVHSAPNSKWLKGVDTTNCKAHFAFIGVSEKEWTQDEILKLNANAFKLVA